MKRLVSENIFWKRIKYTELFPYFPGTAKFCQEIGVTKSNWFSMKSRETMPSLNVLFNIAEYFGITLDELLTYEEGEANIITSPFKRLPVFNPVGKDS